MFSVKAEVRVMGRWDFSQNCHKGQLGTLRTHVMEYVLCVRYYILTNED